MLSMSILIFFSHFYNTSYNTNSLICSPAKRVLHALHACLTLLGGLNVCLALLHALNVCLICIHR